MKARVGIYTSLLVLISVALWVNWRYRSHIDFVENERKYEKMCWIIKNQTPEELKTYLANTKIDFSKGKNAYRPVDVNEVLAMNIFEYSLLAKKYDMLEILLEYDMPPPEDILHRAVAFQDLRAVELLLRHGIHPDGYTIYANAGLVSLFYPLYHLADKSIGEKMVEGCSEKMLAILQLLVSNGMTSDEMFSSNVAGRQTLLRIAALNGDERMVRFLLSTHISDTNVKFNGQTILEACQNAQFDLLKRISQRFLDGSIKMKGSFGSVIDDMIYLYDISRCRVLIENNAT